MHRASTITVLLLLICLAVGKFQWDLQALMAGRDRILVRSPQPHNLSSLDLPTIHRPSLPSYATAHRRKLAPTAVITCMHEKRDCSVLASMLRQDTVHVVDAIVIGITDVNSSAFQLCELNSTFPGVDPQAPSTHAVWGMQHLADVRARKVLQFQHFMAVMARVVNSPHACGRTDSVLAFLDDDVLPCPDATMWLEVIARWLQAFPRIVAAVRAAAGSSGMLLTCEVASRMHAALSRATLDRITAIDAMMDEHLQAWEPGHYLYFHHNLFRHRDDHASPTTLP